MTLTFALPPSLGPAKARARAELLETALLRALDQPVRVVVTTTYGELEELASGAGAEIVWAPAAVCARLTAAAAVFTIVREGRAAYRSALVARRDRAIALSTLGGVRAAWVDPLSAGGYLLIAAHLRERGLDPDRLFVSQTFTGSHRAAVEAVILGAADVTAVSVGSVEADAMAERLRWYAGPRGDQLEAIAISDPCPNDALVITSALAEPDAARVAEKLVPHGRVASRLLSGLDAEGLLRADLATYRKLSRVFVGSEAGRAQPTPAKRPTLRPPRPR